MGAAAVAGGGSSSSGSNSSYSDKLKFLKSNGNSICYVANQCNVWCLVPNKVNDQLEQVLRQKNYDMGLGLIACQLSFNKIVQDLKEEAASQAQAANLLKPFFRYFIYYMFDAPQ